MAKRKSLSSSSCSIGSVTAPRWMTYSAFALLIILALILVYQYTLGVQARARSQYFEQYYDSSSWRLVFLYMNGCGWCDKFKPEWALLNQHHGAELKRHGVMLESYERSDPGASEFSSTVSSYPTIMLISNSSKNTTNLVYSGQRTAEALNAFVIDNIGTKEGFYESEFNIIGQSINAAQGRSSLNISTEKQ